MTRKLLYTFTIAFALLMTNVIAGEGIKINGSSAYKPNGPQPSSKAHSNLRAADQKAVNELRKQLNTLKSEPQQDANAISDIEKQMNSLQGSNGVKSKLTNEVARQISGGNTTYDVTNAQLYSGSVRSLAAAIEQRGANAGRMWAVFAAGSGGNDTIFAYYSDDDGITYSGYGYVAIAATESVNYDDLDIEIIENTTGDKYLWIAYGSTEFSSNRGIAKIFIFNVTTFGGAGLELTWPGVTTATHSLYSVRITSDNSWWPGAPWVYIVASCDSFTTSTTSKYVDQRIARCNGPYTTAPTMIYELERGTEYVAQDIGVNLYSDISINSEGGTDSILVSGNGYFSGFYGGEGCFFTKTTNTAGGGRNFYVDGPDSTLRKTYGRLCSHGAYDPVTMYMYQNISAGGNNVNYVRTPTSYGRFEENYTFYDYDGIRTSPGTFVFQPDVIAPWFSSKFYMAYITWGATSVEDSVNYIIHDPNTIAINDFRGPMNLVSPSGTQGAKPLFRYANNDSCAVLYAGTGPSDIWSAVGCTGPVVSSINDLTSGSVFVLSPNPAIGQTQLTFRLSNYQNVEINIVDINGKLIQSVLNDKMNEGQHTVDINLQNLSSGVYYCVMNANEKSSTVKLVVMK